MANQPSKYSKFLIGAASAALVASAVAPVASAADFKDTKGNTHETAIDALSDAKVISGYPDGTFLPNKTLTRSDVVKMLGKWLVNTQGVEVPTDYKTKPRFADQTSKTNEELLKYSAVVKDNGVFNGLENGTLDATADITRENMALVLVRAFDTVHKTDLVAYVAEKEFNKDVTDRATAKAEARPYIDVLDFFDITNPAAPQFNPKATTTRGQFASFLYKTTNVEISDINAEVDSITATNNTTVEVTFKTEIEDIKALDFAIEGLTVSNASVKQTGGNKVVVLTTSAQVGDKEYTVTANGTKLGTFKGVSAVVPTGVKVTSSQQGVIGNEVTVSAQVTVAEGQSKAGIPVTFNVENSNNSNSKIEVEAFTNAEGVATYSYTRYYASTDTVTAYATSKSSVFSTGKVYWANAAQLTIKDITEATSLTNGSKKVYEINSAKNANGYVFVAFEQNLNKTPDKITKDVVVEGVTTYNTDGTVANVKYPFQATTGGVAVTAVKLDANGKANLVLTGSNASATPIVYEGSYDLTNTDITKRSVPAYSATALQAKGSEVKFELKHELGLTIKAEGVQNAAIYLNNEQTGGRDYTVTYTDKDGKVASPGTKVFVALPRVGGSTFLVDDNGIQIAPNSSDNVNDYYSLTIESKGEVSFTVASRTNNNYVAPIVFINNSNATTTMLDANDLQAQAEITYFVNEVVFAAELSALNAPNGTPVSSVLSNGTPAYFTYSLVDQNGKPRAFNQATDVAFEVKAGTGAVTAVGTAGNTVIQPGTTQTVRGTIVAGQTSANVAVSSITPSAVTVTATGSRAGVVLPSTSPASVTVNFSQYGTGAATGVISNINKTLDVFNIGNVVYSYATGAYQEAGSAITKGAFEALLTDSSRVSVTIDADGKFTFNVLSSGNIGSVVNAVNNATSKELVKSALTGYSAYEALSTDAKTSAVDAIWTALGDSTTYTAASLTAALKESDYTISGTFAYVAGAAGTPNEPTAAELTVGAGTGKIDVKITERATITPYTSEQLNGFKVKFVSGDMQKVEVSGKTVTVTLEKEKNLEGVYTGKIDQTKLSQLGDQLAAAPLADGSGKKLGDIFKLDLVVDTTPDLNNLVGQELTTAGGVNEVAPATESLVFTYNEAVKVPAGTNLTIAVEGTTATQTIAAANVTGSGSVTIGLASGTILNANLVEALKTAGTITVNGVEANTGTKTVIKKVKKATN